MADESAARPRTNTRLKGEAPPGLDHGAGESQRQRIGRYEVMKTIGKGAMGVVYKARDPLLSLIHISEPTRLRRISYAVFCLRTSSKRRLLSLIHI